MDFEQSWGALEQHSIENASWGWGEKYWLTLHSVTIWCTFSRSIAVTCLSQHVQPILHLWGVFASKKNGKFSLDTCRFLSTILPNRGPPAETQTILGDPWGNHDHTRKNAMIRARRLHHPRTDCYRDLLFPAASCRSYFRGWHDYKGDHGLSSAIGKFANFNFVWW